MDCNLDENGMRRVSLRQRLLVGVLGVAAVAGVVRWVAWQPQSVPPQTEVPPAEAAPARDAHRTAAEQGGRPWRYGPPGARFTVIGYADLECPHCRAYFPVLQRWIDAHPDVNWQWHHLPLVLHEPAASAGARLVECIGEAGGAAAFWQGVAWVYAHTRGDGQGVPEGLRYPGMTPATEACLSRDEVDAVVRDEADEATRSGVTATPALRLRDNQSGASLLLHGPVEGDALLSALDLVVTQGAATKEPSKPDDMNAEALGAMPR